jgi:hypothetical protein
LANAVAASGETIIYLHPSGTCFVAVFTDDPECGGIYEKHLYEVDGGIEVKSPCTDRFNRVFTKASELLKYLQFKKSDWTAELLEEK